MAENGFERMRSPHRIFRLSALGALAGLAVFLIWEQRKTHRLRLHLLAMQRQALELASLRAENHDLGAWRITPDEYARLCRLDAEAVNLRAQIKAARAAPPPSTPPRDGGRERTAATDWKLAGQATPQAALESVLFAALHQDIEHLAPLLVFDARTRAQADAFFAELPEETRRQYGGPEGIVATMLAANVPANLSGMETLADSQQPDQAMLLMSIQRADGTNRSTFFSFLRGDGGWQLKVPEAIFVAYERQLGGGSKASPSMGASQSGNSPGK